MLEDVEVFAGVSPDALAALIQASNRRVFARGQELMRQGDASTCMHVILRGQVAVQRRHPDLTEPIVLAVLGPGEVVGEMGVLEGEPRSATVIAVREAETLEISGDQIADLIVRSPETTRELLLTISRRLRSADELIAELEARRARKPDA